MMILFLVNELSSSDISGGFDNAEYSSTSPKFGLELPTNRGSNDRLEGNIKGIMRDPSSRTLGVHTGRRGVSKPSTPVKSERFINVKKAQPKTCQSSSLPASMVKSESIHVYILSTNLCGRMVERSEFGSTVDTHNGGSSPCRIRVRKFVSEHKPMPDRQENL